MINDKKKFSCACCGYYVFDYDPVETHSVCPVCYWEEDIVQESDPKFKGGANNLSLFEAKINYKEFGAIEEKFKQYVREPNKDELS